MCGLIGIVRSGGHRLDIAHQDLTGHRDRMSHRGPDDAGDWSDSTAWLGHRRLAIMDPAHGQAPFVVDRPAGGTCVVAFNGELLNHLEIRKTLAADGATFRTSCDGETAAVAIAHWGSAALRRFRGMFAVAWYQPETRVLTLARDPFGVVPLYYRVDETSAAFASELRTLAALDGRPMRPDPVVVSAYLSTIRITLGERTLIDGLRTVLPGQQVSFELAGDAPHVATERWWTPPEPTGELSGPAADALILDAITSSLEAHLQSDVEVCSLLSGGVDSAILTSIAADRVPRLRTFTAVGGDGRADPDRDAASLMARHLGLAQTEVDVDRTDEPPLERWRRMVATLGVPLGTPNEIAINALAEGVAKSGVKVAIGGEGADELFGGYEPVLRIVSSVAQAVESPTHAAVTLLGAMSWLAPAQKAAALRPDWLESSENDRLLVEETARAIDSGGPASNPRSYLRWLQEINLTGLLGRLNHATMLASVEARPPYADRHVADAVARVATEDLFRIPSDPAASAETKTTLRRAFTDRLPTEIAERPKASFPTPFRDWSHRMLGTRDVADALEPLVLEGTLEAVLAPESPHALLAWPLANLGVWCRETGASLDL